jgi:hypothetical protein
MSALDVNERTLTVALPRPSPTVEALAVAAAERWPVACPFEFVPYRGVAELLEVVREHAIDVVLVDASEPASEGLHDALPDQLRVDVLSAGAVPRGGARPELIAGPDRARALEQLFTLANLGRRLAQQRGEVARLKSRLRLYENWVQSAVARDAERAAALAPLLARLGETATSEWTTATPSLPELPPALLAGHTEGRRVSRQRLRPEQLAREVQRLVGAEARAHEVRVDIHTTGDAPRIWCDRREVVHALVGVAARAIEAAGSGGAVTITLHPGAEAGDATGCRVTVDARRAGGAALTLELDDRAHDRLREVTEAHGGRYAVDGHFELSLPSDPRSRRGGVRVSVVSDPAFGAALTEALLARGTRAIFAPPSVDPARLAARVLAGQETVLSLPSLPEGLRDRLAIDAEPGTADLGPDGEGRPLEA